MRCWCSAGPKSFSFSEVRSKLAHHRRKIRKARGDEACIVNLHRLLAGQPHDQCGHRDAMIHVRYNQSAASRASATVHNQIVAIDFDFNAVASQHNSGRVEAVGLLNPQFFQPPHVSYALGERSSDREDRIFIDHRRRT